MLKTINRPELPAQHNITIDDVIIQPTTAAAWLDKNVGNRKFRSTTVAKYARDMAAGEWQFTGDAIRFDETGSVIDGQHRLKACVKAGVPFRSLVIYNLKADTQDVIDGAITRKAADALTIGGFHHASHIVIALRNCPAIRDSRLFLTTVSRL